MQWRSPAMLDWALAERSPGQAGSWPGCGEVDLDATARHQESADLHGRAWRWRRKELLPDLVEVMEVVEVGEENLRLHRVLEIATGRLEDAAQVLHDVARLLLDVGAVIGKRGILARLGRHANLVVGGDLPGGVKRVAANDALTVMGHRRWRFRAGHPVAPDGRAHAPKIDLHLAAGHEQRAYLDRGARRRRGKELFPHLVEVVEVVEIGKEDLRLHHVLELAAGRLEHTAQVIEDVARLFLDRGAVIRERRILARLGRHA